MLHQPRCSLQQLRPLPRTHSVSIGASDWLITKEDTNDWLFGNRDTNDWLFGNRDSNDWLATKEDANDWLLTNGDTSTRKFMHQRLVNVNQMRIETSQS